MDSINNAAWAAMADADADAVWQKAVEAAPRWSMLEHLDKLSRAETTVRLMLSTRVEGFTRIEGKLLGADERGLIMELDGPSEPRMVLFLWHTVGAIEPLDGADAVFAPPSP